MADTDAVDRNKQKKPKAEKQILNVSRSDG
jgi:hypothetical protein